MKTPSNFLIFPNSQSWRGKRSKDKHDRPAYVARQEQLFPLIASAFSPSSFHCEHAYAYKQNAFLKKRTSERSMEGFSSALMVSMLSYAVFFKKNITELCQFLQKKIFCMFMRDILECVVSPCLPPFLS